MGAYKWIVYRKNRNMEKFLIKHKFKVWLTALIPLAVFFGGPIQVLFVTIQILALVTMFWIGWDGIFDNL